MMSKSFLGILLAIAAGSACAVPQTGDDAERTAKGVEITLLVPGGIRAAAEQLVPDFEHKTGYTVTMTVGNGNGTRQQIARGEAFDVSILQPPYPDVLASGHVVTDSATPIASIIMGVAVRKGAPTPDVSTPEAVRRTLVAATSISYPNAANGSAAGARLDGLLRTMGLTEQMEPKITRGVGAAGAMALVAKGDAEIGLTWLSEIVDPGVDVVGPLPLEMSEPEAMVGFISTHAKDPVAARALLDYFTSAEAAEVYRARRMQPDRR